MVRIRGITPEEAPLWLKAVYALARRSVGKVTGKARVVAPIQVHALRARLLFGMAQMELAQAKVHAVPAGMKALASLRAASMIGCPY